MSLTSNKIAPDALTLQHLGAGTMFCWPDLPSAVQQQILAAAEDIIGLIPVATARRDIENLLVRRGYSNRSDQVRPGENAGFK